MEKHLRFDNARVTDLPVRKAFAHISLGIRYAAKSPSVSDAQVEGKYPSWMLSNSTASRKAADRKVGTKVLSIAEELPAYHSVQQLSVTSCAASTPLRPFWVHEKISVFVVISAVWPGVGSFQESPH